MQRKVHIRNKSNDEDTKVNGRMININFTTTISHNDFFKPGAIIFLKV